MKQLRRLLAAATLFLPLLASAQLSITTYTAPTCEVFAGAGTGKALAAAPVADYSILECLKKIPKDGDFTLKVKANRKTSTTTTPPVTPPPVFGWVLLGEERKQYVLDGRYTVRFGDGVKAWATRVIEGAFVCDTNAFGDPNPGAAKRCERSASKTTDPLTGPPVAPPPTTPVDPPPVTPPVTPPSTGSAMPSEGQFVNATPRGPITAVSGATYTGFRITSSNGACITVPAGVSNVTIIANEIGPCLGSEGKAVDIRPGAGANIKVLGNYIHEATTALYADRCKFPVLFQYNRVRGLRGPMPRGQMVQFNTCDSSGGYGDVDRNLSYGHSEVEDHTNVYNTGKVRITCNRFTSGSKQSKSGTAVLVGDANGGDDISVKFNDIVNVSNVGGGIAGGTNIEFIGNRIFMDARQSGLYTNVGLYVWNQGNGACSGHRIYDNRVFVWNSEGRSNPWWNNGNCGAVDMKGNVFGDTTLSASIIDTVRDECK